MQAPAGRLPRSGLASGSEAERATSESLRTIARTTNCEREASGYFAQGCDGIFALRGEVWLRRSLSAIRGSDADGADDTGARLPATMVSVCSGFGGPRFSRNHTTSGLCL